MSMAKRALNIGNTMNKIPDEIMERILLLVPVEDLANFMTLWFSIITNPRFIFSKLKFDWPLASSSFTAPNLLFILEKRGKLIFTLNRPNLQYPNLICWKKIKLYSIHEITLWSQSESDATCMHGLICFHNRFRSIYICNPLTREFITAPKTEHNARLQCGGDLLPLATGFGFCSSINKFKIVHVCGCRLAYQSYPQFIHKWAEVLTVGDDKSWRRIKIWDDGDGPCHPIKKALIIDDVMYWKTAPKDFVIRLVTFDICKEEFKMIEVSVPGFESQSPYELIELEGKLCIAQRFQNNENGDGRNFFVPEDMTELGEGWIMKHRLQFQGRTRGPFYNFPSEAIGIISKNIYVMKSSRQETVYFDFRTGQLLRCEPYSGPYYPIIDVVPYVPSLAPILGDTSKFIIVDN